MEDLIPQFMITYVGGDRPDNPEEGKKYFAEYMNWLDSLGDTAVSPANPITNTRTVHADGKVSTGGSTSMSGFTIIEADSIEAALEVAKTCPFLEVNGSLEVSEMVEMQGNP